jgi:hypothetical protein
MATSFVTPPGVALTTSFQVVYTCPASTAAMVTFCQVTNVDGATSVDIDVDWTDASAANAATPLAYTMNVPADAAVVPISGRLTLQAGDTIRAKAATAGDAVITLSVMEIT